MFVDAERKGELGKLPCKLAYDMEVCSGVALVEGLGTSSTEIARASSLPDPDASPKSFASFVVAEGT